MPRIFSVSELTRGVKELLESEFPFVWIKGQVGTVARPGSGHIYFTLKDERSVLNVVWFRANQTGPGSVSSPELITGLDVVCAGRLTVYGPRGVYQLVAELVQSEGVGRLHLEFEALKRKLSQEGLFEAERKRPLPPHPARVGLITAPSGAALKDFLRLAADRGRGATFRIYPSLVQGPEAGQALASALEEACLEGWAEVLVLLRGGGSLEDLWPFNTEPVARAVAASPVPILTGVGHEIDVTIADLAADVRASTPSHAAQMLWPERSVLVQQVDELGTSLLQAWEARIRDERRRLKETERALSWLSPAKLLQRFSERADFLAHRLDQAGRTFRAEKEAALETLLRRIISASPAGYWELRRADIEHAGKRLLLAITALSRGKEEQIGSLDKQLQALDPERPLDRGFALVSRVSDGSLLRSPGQVKPGDLLRIRLRQGSFSARVAEREESG